MKLIKKMSNKISALFAALLAVISAVLLPVYVQAADWTPLISADDFTGIRDDMLTMVAGVVGLILIITGLGYLLKGMFR